MHNVSDELLEFINYPEVIEFFDRHLNDGKNGFGVNYKNNKISAIKMYSELTDEQELIDTDYRLVEFYDKYRSLIYPCKIEPWSNGIGIKMKDGKLLYYLYVKFKENINLFSCKYPGYSRQLVTLEIPIEKEDKIFGTNEERESFIFHNSPPNKNIISSLETFPIILKDFVRAKNCPFIIKEENPEKWRFDYRKIDHIWYSQQPSYKKICAWPLREFLDYDDLAWSDTKRLELFFDKECEYSCIYDDNFLYPTVTACYKQDCWYKLHKLIR